MAKGMSALKITLIISAVIVIAACVGNPSGGEDLSLSETRRRRHRQYAIYGQGGYGAQIQQGYGQNQHGYGHIQPHYVPIQHAYSQHNGYGQPNGYVQVAGYARGYGQTNGYTLAHRYGQLNGYTGNGREYFHIGFRPTIQRYGYESEDGYQNAYGNPTGYESDEKHSYETKSENSNVYEENLKGYDSAEHHQPKREKSEDDSYTKGHGDENEYETKSVEKTKANKGYKNAKSQKYTDKKKEKKYNSYVNDL
ncbi:hornerin-like isoform X2 [Daphnia carinata]|uniref:hornerin-like isoform X2 n=1 Tax=Daphnia carinata TaxID=120202 RepID=UPI0028694743|nr:hornerin-like isoform X2 [Daphnia carinata]